MVIGAPPLLNYASDTIRAKYLPDILAGKKFICLAISEAAAGSDVRGIKTTAKRTKDGKYYEVTGSKKWIVRSFLPLATAADNRSDQVRRCSSLLASELTLCQRQLCRLVYDRRRHRQGAVDAPHRAGRQR